MSSSIPVGHKIVKSSVRLIEYLFISTLSDILKMEIAFLDFLIQ